MLLAIKEAIKPVKVDCFKDNCFMYSLFKREKEEEGYILFPNILFSGCGYIRQR